MRNPLQVFLEAARRVREEASHLPHTLLRPRSQQEQLARDSLAELEHVHKRLLSVNFPTGKHPRPEDRELWAFDLKHDLEEVVKASQELVEAALAVPRTPRRTPGVSQQDYLQQLQTHQKAGQHHRELEQQQQRNCDRVFSQLYWVDVRGTSTPQSASSQVTGKQAAGALDEEPAVSKAPVVPKPGDSPVSAPQPTPPASPISVQVKKKRSTEAGEARDKLIAALTRHHQYANGSCLNQDPIVCNELARKADVAESTASVFFKEGFKGHRKYRRLCRDRSKLIAALKILNDEFAPHLLYDDNRSSENEPDEDE
jgi:hypothetical protein